MSTLSQQLVRPAQAGPSAGTAARAVRDDRRSPSHRREQSALDQYLEEIAEHPLISREEEVKLARRVSEGDREALDVLVQANLRFVVSVAKRYKDHGVPLTDLISEGNLGLIRAAHKFNPDQGVRFVTYAVWWVRQAILQALAEQSRIVRVPLHRTGKLYRLGRRSSALAQLLGREPTSAELADGTELTATDVEALQSMSQGHLSLDAPLSGDTELSLVDFLPDETSEPADMPAMIEERLAAIEGALSTLREREARILRLYFGLDGEDPRTLEEIGAVLGITRERVRQIKENALARMRRPRIADRLANLY